MTDDIEDDLGVTAPDAGQLKSIEGLVNKALELMSNITSTEEYLSAAKAELHLLNTKTLPDAMASAGSSLFKTEAGVKVEVKPFVNGSLPKDEDKRAAALRWIESVEAGDIIKNKISIEFERGEDNLAGEVRAKLEELELAFEQKRDIHAQTLGAFARERLEKGEETPLELLGLFAGRAAKITLPKEPKPKADKPAKKAKS